MLTNKELIELQEKEFEEQIRYKYCSRCGIKIFGPAIITVDATYDQLCFYQHTIDEYLKSKQ